jgi:hypothetical protein
MSLMGCIDNQQYYNKETLKQGYDKETLRMIDECGKMDSYTYKDAKCYTNLSMQRRDPTICAWINSSYMRDFCFLDGVRLTLDPSVCDKVTKSVCSGRTGLGDVSCDSPRSNCYYITAVGLNRTDLCEKMMGEFYDPGSGAVLDKWNCYLKIFENTGSSNASICEKIPREYLMSEDCYVNAAITTGNLSICNSASSRDVCIILVVKAHLQEWKDTPLICDQIPYGGSRGRCYTEMAIATGNVSWCDKNPENVESEYLTEGTQDDCYMQFGVNSSNFSVCDMIHNKAYINYCHIDVGTDTRNTSVCEIVEPPYQDLCYASMGSAQKNKSLCDKIQNYTTRDLCYYESSH